MHDAKRLLDFPSLLNARDLGGYPTVDGSKTRWRSLLRSDDLAQLTLAGLQALGLEVIDGVGNFCVAKFAETKGKTAAEALAYLKERGVTVRGLGGYRMPNHLRISVGTVDGNNAALTHLKSFLGGK